MHSQSPDVIVKNFQRNMLIRNTCRNLVVVSKLGGYETRGFFGMFDAVFNKYDSARVEEVGINRAAAEWVLRCGGGIRWSSGTFLKDYNSLPVGKYRELKIAEIDGTDSCIMEHGFEHLKGLTELYKITLVNNKYLTDESLGFLGAYTKNRLRWLHLASNGNITDAGILHLQQLAKLEYLKLENLHEVKNPESVVKLLQLKIPDCKIEFPPYTNSTA